MNEQEKQEFEALKCEVIRQRIWIETIYKYVYNLGIRNKSSLSDDAILKGAGPFGSDLQLQQLTRQGNINAAAERCSDLTGVFFPEAKEAVKQTMNI